MNEAGGKSAEKSIRERLVSLWKYGKDPKFSPPPPEPSPPPPDAPARVKIRSGKSSATVECPQPSAAPSSTSSPDGLGSAVWKVVGAAATGITATGFVIAIGGAIFWIRFNEVGLPATQAVSLLSKSELLVQGAEQMAIFLAIGLGAVAVLFVFDPKGTMKKGPLLVLTGLALGAIAFVLSAGLPPGWGVALGALAVCLFLSVVVIGLESGPRFWPVALSLFVASLIFSGAAGILITATRSHAQAVAVLRGGSDAGLSGIYVTANDDKVYLGRPAPDRDGSDTDRRAIFDVPRDGASFAVGPLESIGRAEARSEVLLEELREDRERNPTAPASAAAEGSGSDSGDETLAAPASPPAEAIPPETLAEVASAFVGEIRVHHRVDADWGCLVRFASAQSSGYGHWWTPCSFATRLEGRPMSAIRDALALPGRFQSSYDLRLTAHLPSKGAVLYLTGNASAQCAHSAPAPCGHRFPGGGPQAYLLEPQLVGAVVEECTTTREDQAPRWEKCRPGSSAMGAGVG